MRPSPTAADERPIWRQVGVPTEHGGWGLTGEPVLLGLLVAWSLPGLAMGLAALLGFVLRTPLKLVLVDRWRGRWLPRTTMAARLAVVEATIAIALVVWAALGAEDTRFWWPLAAAAPLIAVELWFDMRSRSRRLLPELAGAVGVSSVAAAIALIGGAAMPLSLGLWAVLGARVVAAIPYVRSQVFRLHGRPPQLGVSMFAQAVALAVGVATWQLGAITWVPVAALAMIVAFHLVTLRMPPKRPAVLGSQQMLLGFGLVFVTALAA